jgi:two-component system, chemotaxis family, sensor kinase CheA
MNFEFSPELRRELLDDFYAECDEQLSTIRVRLTELESADPAHLPGAALEALFRSIHSLKGNAAIVGIRQAETLSHATEDYLRVLLPGNANLGPEGLEVLHNAAHRLEQIVSAHRHQQPVPDIEDLCFRISALVGNSPRATEGKSPAASVAGAFPSTSAPEPLRAAKNRWRCTFSPSRELDERGIDINAVRARLGAIGEIFQASPSVRPGGAMVFEFILDVRDMPQDLATWAADGMAFQPVENAVSPSAPAPVAAPPADVGVHAATFFVAPSHIVRVELSRLDELMRIAGELVIHRSRLEDRINQPDTAKGDLKEVNLSFARTMGELRKAITRVRLVSIAEIFTRMPFVVRDLARESGKKVRLVLEGQQTEVDKYLVERLKEPLLHLVRNAFSHGIETPDERVAAGKPAEGTITLSARTVGESIVIQIHDDGQGVNARRVPAHAAVLGLPVPENLDETTLLKVLCTPGFSTRTEADRASGRGVGMAVVQNTVRELGGTLALQTVPGRETRFTLRLPVTLSIAETFIVSVGAQTCAVPQAFVDEIVEMSEDQVRSIKHVQVIPYRDGVLPLVRLRSLFGESPLTRREQRVLVVSTERGCTGLVVDRVHAQREVVVRPMNDPLIQVSGVSGATELGDGRPVLILDPIALTSGVVRPSELLIDTAALVPTLA